MIKEVDFSEKPDVEVIRHCENLLKYAKDGSLRGVLYSCAWDDGYVSDGWSPIANDKRAAMLGSVFMAASKMQIQTDGVDEQFINR